MSYKNLGTASDRALRRQAGQQAALTIPGTCPGCPRRSRAHSRPTSLQEEGPPSNSFNHRLRGKRSAVVPAPRCGAPAPTLCLPLTAALQAEAGLVAHAFQAAAGLLALQHARQGGGRAVGGSSAAAACQSVAPSTAAPGVQQGRAREVSVQRWWAAERASCSLAPAECNPCHLPPHLDALAGGIGGPRQPALGALAAVVSAVLAGAGPGRLRVLLIRLVRPRLTGPPRVALRLQRLPAGQHQGTCSSPPAGAGGMAAPWWGGRQRGQGGRKGNARAAT